MATMLLCIVLLLLVTICGQFTLGWELLARENTLRGNPQRPSGRTCRNSVQGRTLITDDQGFLCNRDQLDLTSGCCKSGKQYACSTCTLTDQCCEELEYCVSCCLKPQHRPDEMYKLVYRARQRPDVGNFSDAFDYCLGTCRTHAHSTSHENDYIGSHHHCFSVLGRPMLSGPVPKGAVDGVTVVVSKAGDACDKACAAQGGRTCSQKHLPILNNCDRLREHVGCEAGCEHDEFHPYLPGYVVSSASKQEHPALCIISKKVASGDCLGSKKNVQRLCPCTSSSASDATKSGPE